MVLGYHACKDVWDITIGEKLLCKINTVTLTMYIFAVAALKDGAVVGHVPQKISAACSMFLHHGGSTWSQVAEAKPIRQS